MSIEDLKFLINLYKQMIVKLAEEREKHGSQPGSIYLEGHIDAFKHVIKDLQTAVDAHERKLNEIHS